MTKLKALSWPLRILLLLFGVTIVVPVLSLLIFRFVPPPATPLMVITRVMDGPVSQSWMPLNQISPHLVRAVIAAEDGKFCAHSGFDWNAIDAALDHNAKGRRLRGASTISQQTAKNLFLNQSRTWLRKGIEAYFTLLMEGLWPKRRIMEAYLNLIEWGPGRFGAEAAAEANFHKPAAKLTPSEAARLAAILPNPRRYRADVPGPYVARQSGVILARMGEVMRSRLDACVNR